MINVIRWNGLPGLIDRDYAAIFSRVNNKLICVRIKASELESEKILEEAKSHHLFDCISSTEFSETSVKLLTLCLTERCNSSCRYCFLDANSTGCVMSINQMHAAIDFGFKRFQGNTIVLSAFGGEPSTQPELIYEMVKYAKKVQDKYFIPELRFSITTNGIMSQELLQFLVDNKFEISLSFDGVKEVQDFQRPLPNGNGSYDLAIKTISFLISKGVKVKVRATVTQFSVGKMQDATRLLGELGVSQLHFEPVTAGGRAATNEKALQRPNANQYANNLLECIEIAKFYGLDINCTPFVRCDGTITSRIVVGASGMVSSCIEVQNEHHVLANSFKMGTIKDTGDGELYFSSAREICASDGEKNANCCTCPFEIFCKGSCPTRNIRATGCSNKTDPFKCEMIKIIMPTMLEKFYNSTYNS